MRIQKFQSCGSNNEITLKIPHDLLGLVPNATYYLHFLDHVDLKHAHLYELLILPVHFDDIDSFFSIRLNLGNVPNATANALGVLAEAGIELIHCNATDSIAGRRGIIEASLVSKQHDLKAIDALFIGKADSRFVMSRAEAAGRNEDLTTEIRANGKNVNSAIVRYFGKYIEGRKYVKDMDLFKRRATQIRSMQSVDTILYEEGDYVRIRIPPKVLPYLNDKFGQPSEAYLSNYNVTLTVDKAFDEISISFLNPAETLVNWSAIIDSNEWSKILHAVTDFLGSKEIDFRILRVKPVVPNHQFAIDLVCDISKTEYPLYDGSTLAWAHMSEIASQWLPQARLSPRALKSLVVKAESNYPSRKLTHFHQWDQFGVFWFRVLMLKENGHIDSLEDVGPPPCSTDQLFFSNDRLQEISKHLAENLDDIITVGPVHDALIRSSIGGVHAQLQQATDDKRPRATARVVWDSRDPDTVIPTMSSDIAITLLMEKRRNLVFCVAYKNKAPVELEQQFCEAVGTILSQHEAARKPDLASIVSDVAAKTLAKVSFKLQIEDFYGRGSRPKEEFSSSAKTRFTELGRGYPRQKWLVDRFPIVGNWKLAAQLDKYLQQDFGEIDDGKREIVLVDIGVASGAMTTLFVLNQIKSTRGGDVRNILERMRVLLFDISEGVLRDCVDSLFEIPWDEKIPFTENILAMQKQEYAAILGDPHKTFAYERDGTDLPGCLQGRADIVVSGFCHHHMNNNGREDACKQMARVARPGGFVGVVDESLTLAQYIAYRMNHIRDHEEAAMESFLQQTELHASLFDGTGVDIQHKPPKALGEEYYVFWGVKEGQRDRDANLFNGLADACQREGVHRITRAKQRESRIDTMEVERPVANPARDAKIQDIELGTHVLIRQTMRTWIVRYTESDATEAGEIENCLGLNYLAVLLEKPNGSFSAQDLARLAGGSPAGEIAPVSLEELQGATFALSSNKDAEIDVDFVDQKILQIDKWIREGKATKADLRNREALVEYRRNSTKPNGESREDSPELKLVRSVRTSLRRAYQDNSLKNPLGFLRYEDKFARLIIHLKDSIQTVGEFAYRPRGTPPVWQVRVQPPH